MLRLTTLRRRRLLLFASLFSAAVLMGCQAAPQSPDGPESPGMETPDNGDTVSFADDVQPIFTARCAGCHSSGGAAELAGIELLLTSNVAHNLLVNQRSVQNSDLILVVPGDANASLLFQKVNSDSPPVGGRMPQFQPALSQAQIDVIRDWIDQGALDN